MNMAVSYHLPDGVGLDSSRTEECFADVSLSGIPKEWLSNVLRAVSASLGRLSETCSTVSIQA